MKRYAPAATRNRDPILSVLREVLPGPRETGRPLVLEIAAGTGEHGVYFAQALPHLDWQPTDQGPQALASIAAWQAEVALPNLRPPLDVDVTAAWPVDAVDAVYCCNMIHISPWECCLALLEGAAARLPAGGPLVLYGPYKRNGVHTAPSNAAFDASLRSRDPTWGVRELEVVVAQAADRGFQLDRVVELPANNLVVVLRRG